MAIVAVFNVSKSFTRFWAFHNCMAQNLSEFIFSYHSHHSYKIFAHLSFQNFILDGFFCATFFGSVLRAIHLVEKRHHFVVDVVLIAHEICKRNDNSAKNVDSSSARPCIVKYLIWNASKAINFTLLDNITATLRLLHIFSDFRLSRQIALWFWIHHIMFKHKTNSVYNL